MYLTAEMVPLAQFSNRVPSNERHELGERLIAFKPASLMLAPKNWFGTGFVWKAQCSNRHHLTLANVVKGFLVYPPHHAAKH